MPTRGSALQTRRVRTGLLARLLLAASVATVIGLVVGAGTASAILTHPTRTFNFSIGGPTECASEFAAQGAADIAVDESRNLIYVVCLRPGKGPVIKRFNANGTPANFNFKAPYIAGNEIIGHPGSPRNEWGGNQFSHTIMGISVNNSPNHNGELAVAAQCPICGPIGATGRQSVIFSTSGEALRELPKTELGEASDVAYDQDGNLYQLDAYSAGSMIHKFDGVSQGEVERLFPAHAREFVRPDTDGDVWTGIPDCALCTHPIKYDASAFSKDLSTKQVETYENEVNFVKPSPFVAPNGSGLLPVNTNFEGLDVDLTTNYVYTIEASGAGINTWFEGSPEEFAYRNGPAIGAGEVTPSYGSGLDVTDEGDVYVTQGREVWVYGPGVVLPDIHTPAPKLEDLTRTQATVTGRVERDGAMGGKPITGCALEYDTSASDLGTPGVENTVPCTPDPSGGEFTAESTNVSATTPNTLATGTQYFYRFRAARADGTNYGGTRTFTPPYVPETRTEAAEVNEPNAATLHGSFNPAGQSTEYLFQYGPTTSYGQQTPITAGGSGSGKVSVEADLKNLPSGRIFHYRIVAFTSEGATFGEDMTFRTASPPEIGGVSASDLTGSSATLEARVDPVGYATEYHFEYGPTPEYGTSVPLSDEAIGSGNGYVPVSQAISGLQEGITYHYRVVATNKWGTSVSEDATFDFVPPSCPNAHARQQTGAAYLPDCRAYEIVSPENAGSIFYFPHNMLPNQLFTSNTGFWNWAHNTGLATSPSRFAFYGALGTPPEASPPNSLMDLYVATRTNTGWVQSAPTFQGDEALFGTEKECSDSLDLCSDVIADDGVFSSFQGESAPYLFDLDGRALGQLPTNVKVVEGGNDYHGDERFSDGFSHFAWSARNARFTPDGKLFGEETPNSKPGEEQFYPGSAYLNDIQAKTVKLISRLPSGEHIPMDVTLDTDYGCCGPQVDKWPAHIRFPGISRDGSHVLMSVNGNQGQGSIHLYMYVDGSPGIVYDVSRGEGVTYVGMNKAGSIVYFIANMDLTEDGSDTDNSADLYRWTESDDKLTRVSAVPRAQEEKEEAEEVAAEIPLDSRKGNTDACASVFSAACGVTRLETEKDVPFTDISKPPLDERLSDDGSDVYFYSPELLDAQRPGIQNQRNLYVFHDGEVKLVATLDANGPVARIQISPDGHFVGLVTKSRLTGYDNKGRKMMYTYNSVTGVIRCASCRPNGQGPNNDAEASQGGPFMADDGRVFFATRDSLVPQDANGAIVDVYEFVDGRAQLITSGTATRDTTAAGLLFPSVRIGLESVSADGRDVFFSTFETLVEQDLNGPFIKMYDARSGGGFDYQYKLAPCEAADECHGADSTPPPAPLIGTRNELGQSGNVPTPKKKHRKKKHRKRAHGKRHRRHGNARRNHG